MAGKARLPEPIVTAIREHHGTKLIRYFYQKALTRMEPGQGPVQETEYRYPGPQAFDAHPRHPDDRGRGRSGLADAHRADAGEDPRHDPGDRGRLPARRPVRRVRPDDARSRDHLRRPGTDGHDGLPPPHRLPGFDFNREKARRRATATGRKRLLRRPSDASRRRSEEVRRGAAGRAGAGRALPGRTRGADARLARGLDARSRGLRALLRRSENAGAQSPLPRAGPPDRRACLPGGGGRRRLSRRHRDLGPVRRAGGPSAPRTGRAGDRPAARARPAASDGLRPRDRRRRDGRARGAGPPPAGARRPAETAGGGLPARRSR